MGAISNSFIIEYKSVIDEANSIISTVSVSQNKWQKNEFQKGDVAIFENKRAERLSELAKCLQEDIVEKNKQVQKELNILEEEIAANMPKPKEEDPIEKYWREQREEQAKITTKNQL